MHHCRPFACFLKFASVVDLSTTYLGLKLASPLIPGASPLSDSLDMVRRLEDAGAPALVMHSLFEEQIRREPQVGRADPYGPAAYLEQIRKIKEAVRVPVIASLNGTTDVGWTGFSRLMQQAGADALELNIYHISTNLWTASSTVETQTLDIVRAIRMSVTIPVAVKIYPFFSSLASFARQLDEVGVAGLVLFNRHYQPDIDVETQEVVPCFELSEPCELPLRLHWLAVLSGRLQLDLAVTGGVYRPIDAVKAILTGATAVQMVSALLKNGPEYLRTMCEGLRRWMEQHGHDGLDSFRGSMSLEAHPDASGLLRAGTIGLLQSWYPNSGI